MSAPRITPAEAPYEASIEQAFARITPPGTEPLKLFRTLARNPRVLQRMFAANLLDRGNIELRDREIIILRTCARCGSEYEWGVHVAIFAKRAELSSAEISATLRTPPGDAAWTARDASLIKLADELHDTARVSDPLWNRLAAHFSHEQILELIALAGYYHTISFVTNAARVELEAGAARFGDHA